MDTIKISKDFSEYPGAAKREHSIYSGQEFFEEFLRPRFAEIIKTKDTLIVNLDDTAGYSASFLREAFGSLAQEFEPELIKKHLKIISKQEPDWKERIENDYILNASNRKEPELVNA